MRTDATHDSVVTSRWVRSAFVLWCAAITLLLASPARAQGLAALYGRAGAEFQSACPNYLSQNCTLKACGHSVQWNSQNDTVAIPDLGIAPTGNYGQVASIINAACGGLAGDGILATGNSFSMQGSQVESVGHAQAPNHAIASYGMGGVGELGGGTYGLSAPLNYTKALSPDSALSSVGFVSLAHQGSTSQAAVSGSPAYAWQLRNAANERVLGIAAYVPLSFSLATVSGATGAVMSWGAGGGAIMTGATSFRALHVTYGAGAAFRWTAAGPAVPVSLVVRAEEPIDFLYKLLHAYASVTYGNDPFNAGSEFFGLAMGATWAQYDFGYHGYYSGSYVAHAFGFSIHKDLAGAEIIEQLPAHEEGPKPPPSTTPTIPALPVNPILPVPLPPLPQLPPPPESPNVKPECTTDMDCPGDNVCDEGRCLPPL